MASSTDAPFLAYPKDFVEGPLPARHESLYELIRSQKSLPRPAYLLAPPSASAALSTALPNTSLAAVKTLGVPSAAWIEDVSAELRCRIAANEAVRSVIHPVRTGTRVPLWTLKYWRTLSEIHAETAGWNKADDWVSRHARNEQRAQDAANRTRELFETLPWGHGISFAGVGMPIATLRRLLATGHEGWLNTDLVDIGMGLLQRDINRDPRLRHVLLGDCGFQEYLVKRDFEKIKGWASQIRAGKTLFLFPVNKDLHWYAFRVRVEAKNKTIAYGELHNLALSTTLTPAA
jgi:hypothetical protein